MAAPWSSGFSKGWGPLNTHVYMLLQDHYIANQLILAGTIVSDDTLTGILPANWIPTPNVDPLTTAAVNAFYAVGPTDQGLIRQQWVGIPVNTPVTYWVKVLTQRPFSSGWSPGFGPIGSPPHLYALTGLGSNQTTYPPKFAILEPLP